MSRPRRQADRPPEPIGLSSVKSGAYLGVSERVFLTAVEQRLMPRPRRLLDQLLWDADELRTAFEALLKSEAPDDRVTMPSAPSFAAISENSRKIHRTGADERRPSKDDYLREYYEAIGFDPETMSAADEKRLYREARATWRASIPGAPYNKREQNVLLKLRNYECGAMISQMKKKA